MNVARLLIEHSRERGEHPALLDPRTRCTYRMLAGVVARGVSGLAKMGVERGQRVGVLAPEGLRGLTATLAVLARGAVPLLLHSGLSTPELESAEKGLELATIVRHEAWEGWTPVRAAIVEELLRPRKLPQPPSAILEEEAAAYRASDPFVICSSSGTTGRPKQILIPGSEMERRSLLSLEESALGPADRFLCWVSLHFLAGTRRCLMMLRAGGSIVFPGPSGTLMDHILKLKITSTYLTPAHIRILLERATEEVALFPQVSLTSSSSPLSSRERELVRQRITPRFFDAYGANEVGTLAVARPEDQEARPESNGRIVRGVEAQVVDEQDRPLPAGTPGILRFRHPGFPTSYLDEESTRLHFRDGWYYPGDIGHIDGEFLHVAGRADDLISNQGVKFYPAEVEEPFRHPRIRDFAVVPWPHPEAGQVPVACVVPADRFDRELMKKLAQTLAPYKRPVIYLEMEEIPRNEMGKVLRRVLRERLSNLLEPDRPKRQGRTASPRR